MSADGRPPAAGRLFLVVGPSGAGKDSLIAAARERLDPSRFHFARRIITRPLDAGGEVHAEATAEEFIALETAGRFALSWRAHGLAYGIPRGIEAELAAGRGVVANVSRAVIAEARRRFPGLRVLLVTAPPQVLAQRLAARGRETVEAVEARLARAAYAEPQGPDVVRILNDGALEAVVPQFLAALTAP